MGRHVTRCDTAHTFGVEYYWNRTKTHYSGLCMLIAPCGDQTQLSSFRPGRLTYLPPTTSTCHSTREKLMRHSSPGLGRPLPLGAVKAVQGMASSTVQPRSRSRGSLRLPSIETAVWRPGICQLLSALPPFR